MDIFDRIAAALKLVLAGTLVTDPAVVEHLNAIDQHLAADDEHSAAVDAHLSTLDSEVSDEQAGLAVVTAGLTKIADAIAPVVSDTPVSTEPVAGTPLTADELAANAGGTTSAESDEKPASPGDTPTDPAVS